MLLCYPGLAVGQGLIFINPNFHLGGHKFMTRTEIEHRIEYYENELRLALAEARKPEHSGPDGIGVLLWEMDCRRELTELYDDLAFAAERAS